MKTTSYGSLTVEEIQSAVKKWLKTEKGVEVDGDISFRVAGVEDPSDWQARNALSYELVGASFTIKPPRPPDAVHYEKCVMCGQRDADYSNGWCVRCSCDWS